MEAERFHLFVLFVAGPLAVFSKWSIRSRSGFSLCLFATNVIISLPTLLFFRCMLGVSDVVICAFRTELLSSIVYLYFNQRPPCAVIKNLNQRKRGRREQVEPQTEECYSNRGVRTWTHPRTLLFERVRLRSENEVSGKGGAWRSLVEIDCRYTGRS